jgi:hypothetical protein
VAKQYRVDPYINASHAEKAARQAGDANAKLRNQVLDVGREAEQAYRQAGDAAVRAV